MTVALRLMDSATASRSASPQRHDPAACTAAITGGGAAAAVSGLMEARAKHHLRFPPQTLPPGVDGVG